MSTSYSIPSYAKPDSGVIFDKKTLATGVLQAEALSFFKAVAQNTAPEDIRQAFRDIVEQHPEVKQGQGEFTLKDNLLTTTVALALLKDITALAPYLVNDYVPLGTISALIKDLSAGCHVYITHQFNHKGHLPLNLFCMAYAVSAHDLALKVVMDDSVAGYRTFVHEDLQSLTKAMARVAYNPFTAIRLAMGYEAGYVAPSEFAQRFANQLTVLYPNERMALINPNLPCDLQPLQSIEFTTIDVSDHGMEKFPDYLERLLDDHKDLLPKFGTYARQPVSMNEDQVRLITKMLDDFERAGVSRVDILMRGVMQLQGLHKDQYAEMSLDEKNARYLKILIEDAAIMGDEITGWQNAPKLLQINHMIRKEPREMLEALCKNPAHWNVLYRATGDQKYVGKLSERIEKVFTQDLGL